MLRPASLLKVDMAQKELPRHTSIQEFVDAKVQTIPVTDEIIRQIYTAFPTSAKVISGYLTSEQLYWKVTWHWDVLLEAVNHCSGLNIDKAYKDRLARIKASLLTNEPDPKTGYRKSTTPGLPKDLSSHEVIEARHALVKQGKLDLKAIITEADIYSKTTRDPTALMLAFAPVAKPAQGKHVTGYALDIKGDNAEIARIAKSLGGTAYNEGSHVHCEWKNGVDTSGKGGENSVAAAERGSKLAINSGIKQVRHCLLRVE